MKLIQGAQFRIGRILLGLSVSVAAFWFIFSKIQLEELWDAFQRLHLGWFMAGVAGFGMCLLLAAWRWHLMLKIVGAPVHSTATARTVVIGHFFNVLLFGPAGGDLAKSALYCRWYRYKMPEVLATSILDRILGGAGHVLFMLTAVLLAASAGVFSDIPFSTGKLLAGIAIGAGALIILLIIRRYVKKGTGLVRTFDTFTKGFRDLLRSPGTAILGTLISFLVQIAYCASLALSLKAISPGDLPWISMLWTFPIISLVSGAPISFAGAGVREGASVLLLTRYGIAAGDAVAASLLTLMLYLIWAGIGLLLLWRNEQRHRNTPNYPLEPSISVLIPTLNEAKSLPATLQSIPSNPAICEILVADGGSTDGTRHLAAAAGAHVTATRPGRGVQLRQAAVLAKGDVLLFLHADTTLPSNAVQAIHQCLRDPSVVGGGFWKRFDKPTPLMWGSRARCFLRLCLFRRVLADQAIFVRKPVLEAAGGFPDQPLMEEYELCKRLRQQGGLALAGATVVTSARRFHQRGVFSTYLHMAKITLRYHLGSHPADLQADYETPANPEMPPPPDRSGSSPRR